MILYRIILIILSLTTAKCLQAWVAVKLGDPGPKASSRLSLNPLRHIDMFGTIILPFFLLILSRGFLIIGFAKHLAVNQYHFKNLRRDRLLLGLSLVLTHLFISACSAFLLRITPLAALREPLLFLAWANSMLACFNLIPIPPLAGAKIIASLLPQNISYNYRKLEPYTTLIIIVLFMSGAVPTYMRLATESLLRHVYGL